MTKISDAATRYCRANNLDPKALDPGAQQQVIAAVAQETSVAPAVVRDELVAQWSSELGAGQAASAQLGGGMGSSVQARGGPNSALSLRVSGDDPDMRGQRARTGDGRMRSVRSDQLVSNNPSLLARAPDLVELMGDSTVGELRQRFGGLSLSRIANLTQAERKSRLEGPGKGVYFNRLAQEVEDQVRALNPNGKAPLTAAEFDALPFDAQREVMELLSGLDEATLQSVTRRRRPSKVDPLLEALGIEAMPDFAAKLDAEAAAIVRFLDENWSVSVKDKPGESDAVAPRLRPEDAWTQGMKGKGLESLNPSAPELLQQLIKGLLVEGARLGVPIAGQSMNTQIMRHNMNVTLAENYGVKGGGREIDFEAPQDFTDFSKASEALIDFMRSHLSIRAKPKNYAAIKRGDVEPGRPTAFTGEDLHFHLGATSFDLRDSLAAGNVLYSDDEQGRSPLVELVGATLRQGMNMTIKAMYSELIDPLEASGDALRAQIDDARPARGPAAPMNDAQRARLRDFMSALLD